MEHSTEGTVVNLPPPPGAVQRRASEDTSAKLPYAVSATGRLVSVRDVPSGAACDCTCPGCGRGLIAKKGDILTHHFAHESESACAGAFESMAHLLAKQIIADAKYVQVPPAVGRWRGQERVVARAAKAELLNVRLEPWQDGIRPDIVASAAGRDLVIEVFVTHLSEPRKIEIFRERNAAAIEIDLSGFRGQFNLVGFESAVLWQAPRRWLFHAGESVASAALRFEDEERRRIDTEKRQRLADQEREYQKLWEAVQARQQAEQEAADARREEEWAQAEKDRLIGLEAIVGPDVVSFVDALERRLSEAAVTKLGPVDGPRWISSANPRRVFIFQSKSWGWLVDYEQSCHETLRLEVFRRQRAASLATATMLGTTQ